MLLTLCMMLGLTGCGASEEAIQEAAEQRLLVGVCVYDTDYEEMQLFMNYYKDYISQGMLVDFYFSETPNSGEDERNFIKEMKEAGADGIISFYGQDLQDTLNLCEEEEIYYVLGSGSISDEAFNAAKANPYFLGVIGPSAEDEYQAGYGMAERFAGEGAASYLVLSGGAAIGNYMHSTRTKGILDALADELGLTYGQDTEQLAVVPEVTRIETGDPDITITICPGYMGTETGSAALGEALAAGDYDAVAASMSFGNALDTISGAGKSWGHTVLTGTVDCFSESGRKAFQEKDSFGDSKLNYICGKYASMAGPALAAVYNAASGHPETVRDNGTPFRLVQSFWTADTEEKYEELYGFTQGVYENAYSCDELMQVISVFNPDAAFEDFAALTEASDVASVEARILER